MKKKSHLITTFIIAGALSLFVFLYCIYSGVIEVQNNIISVKLNNDTLKKEIKNVHTEIKYMNQLLEFRQIEDSIMFEQLGVIAKTNAQGIYNNTTSIVNLKKSKN
jgi:predicted PurR-regulated permease PerM